MSRSKPLFEKQSGKVIRSAHCAFDPLSCSRHHRSGSSPGDLETSFSPNAICSASRLTALGILTQPGFLAAAEPGKGPRGFGRARHRPLAAVTITKDGGGLLECMEDNPAKLDPPSFRSRPEYNPGGLDPWHQGGASAIPACPHQGATPPLRGSDGQRHCFRKTPRTGALTPHATMFSNPASYSVFDASATCRRTCFGLVSGAVTGTVGAIRGCKQLRWMTPARTGREAETEGTMVLGV